MLHYTLFQVLFNGTKLYMLHYTLCFRYCSTVQSYACCITPSVSDIVQRCIPHYTLCFRYCSTVQSYTYCITPSLSGIVQRYKA